MENRARKWIMRLRTLFTAAIVSGMFPDAGFASSDLVYFQTPSGNIGCMIWQDEGVGLRCDMRDLNPSFRKRPSDCDLDWGSAFAITADGTSGEAICYGDTVMNPDAEALGYGRTLKIAGFSCVSERSGLTCQNAGGHGFFLSKAKQKLF